MGRGQLTEEVKAKLIAEGFEGTVRELRLMPYLLTCLADNRLPDYDKMSKEERAILFDWVTKRMVVSCNEQDGFIVTEKLYDRMNAIVKLGYCNDVIEPTTVDKTIIFEGCDASGKSSIMTKLWNDLDMHKHHIFDRSFLSDFVYARKFHREYHKGVSINNYYHYWADYYANNKKLKVILCTADIDTLYKRCVEKQDELIQNKSEVIAKQELYDDSQSFKLTVETFCEVRNIPLLSLDTTNDSLENSYMKAKQFIEED